MDEDTNHVIERKRDASVVFQTTLRKMVLLDFAVLIAWLFVFFLTPSGHMLGGAFLAFPIMFTSAYRIVLVMPAVMLRGKAVYKLRPDKMFNAPTRFRILAYVSHHPFLYKWVLSGFISAIILHPIIGLILLVYSGIHAKTPRIFAVFIAYAISISGSGLLTFNNVIHLYRQGIDDNVWARLRDDYTSRAYALAASRAHRRRTEVRMRKELDKTKPPPPKKKGGLGPLMELHRTSGTQTV